MSDRGDARLPQTNLFRRLAQARPVPANLFRTISHVRDKSKPFQYVVQVETRNRRSGDPIFRTITVSESERGNIRDILKDAADAIMDSPTAGKEDFTGVRLISARRFKP